MFGECRTVFGGSDVGYLRAINAAEQEALFDPTNGMVSKHILVNAYKYVWKLEPDDDPTKQRKPINFGDPMFNCEKKLQVYCKAPGCKCSGEVWRIQYGSTKGLVS